MNNQYILKINFLLYTIIISFFSFLGFILHHSTILGTLTNKDLLKEWYNSIIPYLDLLIENVYHSYLWIIFIFSLLISAILIIIVIVNKTPKDFLLYPLIISFIPYGFLLKFNIFWLNADVIWIIRFISLILGYFWIYTITNHKQKYITYSVMLLFIIFWIFVWNSMLTLL